MEKSIYLIKIAFLFCYNIINIFFKRNVWVDSREKTVRFVLLI